MNAFTGVRAVLIVSAVAGITLGATGQESGPVWLLVACATVLPALAALNAARRGRRIGGREGAAWRTLAVSMALMTPIYAAEFAGAFVLEDVLIASAYAVGAFAILLVPLPSAAPYQRVVASLDALAVGVFVATAAFWAASGTGLGIAGHATWATSDAAIMAMLGYVGVRRSQRRGIDWAMVWLIGAVAAYLGGLFLSATDAMPYTIGHPADFAYFAGMASFAIAPLTRERRAARTDRILRPVRWGHVLAPYALVAVLTVALLTHQVRVWSDDPTGTIIVLGILSTMLVVLVRQLAMIAEQRRKIELEQSGVIATVSHELRTPLTTVVGFLDLLADWDEFSDDEKIEMVKLMRSQSHVMARVVGDLVDVARQKIDRLDVAPTDLEISEFLATAIDLVPDLADAPVAVHVAEGTRLVADRERMLQIMANYLSNAAQYGSGRVAVVAFEGSGSTFIEVHDDGPGVPDVFRVVIWERFERGAQRQSAIPGSGIGLSVARGIARSHGGDASYRRSERLGGACFSVRIPHHSATLMDGGPAAPAATA